MSILKKRALAEQRLERFGKEFLITNDVVSLRRRLNMDIITLRRLENTAPRNEKRSVKRIRFMFDKAKRRMG